MTKDILLINPNVKWVSSPAYDRIWPPLSLAYCGSILENSGFDVEILDAHVEDVSKQENLEKSKGFDKIFLTTSPLDKWQCPEPKIEPVLKLVKEISKINSEIYLMGAHGTMRPKEVLKKSKSKAVIRGEPESVILDLAKGKDLEKIKGITYRKDQKIVSNSESDPVPLDKLPFPAFHLLPMDKYFYEILGRNFALFEGSRGCPFSCTYCFKSIYNGYRKKSSKKLIKEVKKGIEEFGIKNAYFIDLEFCINKKLVEDLCDFLIKEDYDFNWACQTRFDTVDSELLKKMKKAGCQVIHFGVESGSPRILKKCNKKITLNQIKKSMEKVKKEGIKTVCFFMFGLPGETEEEMKMTIELAKELNPTYASFHIAVPYPKTPLYNDIKGEIENGSLFPSFYKNKEKLEEIRKSAYKSFYLRPSYIISRLKEGDFSLLKQQIGLFLKYITR